MKWLLDTNVLSETIRDRPHTAVVSWMARQPANQLAISIVTMAELEMGISTASEKQHGLREWLEGTIAPSFEDRILFLTVEVLTDWIRLSRFLSAERATRRAADLLIAATARVHDLVLVTRNVRDFTGTKLMVFDPWAGRTHQMDGV